MEFILVIAKITILLTGILFQGIIVERIIHRKQDNNLFVSFIIGVTIIYSIALLGFRLSNIIIYIYIINLVGFVKYRKILMKLRIDKYILLISLPMVIAITFQMIWYWDAVVNWFFHAKVIAHADMFSIEMYSEMNPKPAHTGYPKLLPIIAALISNITSVYNEALPKSSLLYLLLGVFLGFNEVKYFNRLEKNIIYFILISLMGIHSYSGYLDGWLSIYTSLCCLFLISYNKSNNERDMTNLICSLCFLPMLKNEGLAILITFIIVMCINNYSQIRYNIINRLILAFIILTPSLIWSYNKSGSEHGIFNDLSINKILEIELFNYHISILYYFIIFSNLIYVIWCPILLWILLKLFKIKVNNYIWLPIKLSFIYLLFQITVYFILTGQEASSLQHFLEYGVRRTTMPIMMMIFIFNYISLKELKVINNIFNTK